MAFHTSPHSRSVNVKLPGTGDFSDAYKFKADWKLRLLTWSMESSIKKKKRGRKERERGEELWSEIRVELDNHLEKGKEWGRSLTKTRK